MINTIIISFVIILMGVLTIISNRRIYYTERNKNNNPMLRQKKHNTLSFEDVNVIIDSVSNEIITNKYEILYTIKEIKIIPKMDDEIVSITKDILNAFSDEFKENVYMYYSERYFIELITRKAQYFTIKYTKENKPKTK